MMIIMISSGKKLLRHAMLNDLRNRRHIYVFLKQVAMKYYFIISALVNATKPLANLIGDSDGLRRKHLNPEPK